MSQDVVDLHDRLTRAFVEVFATNRNRFWAGGPGYYGVRLTAVAADASEVELEVTFRSGVRYCCFESGCHFSYYEECGWRHLRECMDRQGLAFLPLPTIRKFRAVIEPGAVMEAGMAETPNARFVWEGFQYEVGPWHPITAGAV